MCSSPQFKYVTAGVTKLFFFSLCVYWICEWNFCFEFILFIYLRFMVEYVFCFYIINGAAVVVYNRLSMHIAHISHLLKNTLERNDCVQYARSHMNTRKAIYLIQYNSHFTNICTRNACTSSSATSQFTFAIRNMKWKKLSGSNSNASMCILCNKISLRLVRAAQCSRCGAMQSKSHILCGRQKSDLYRKSSER